jgi:hypothetical protein
MYRLLKKLIPAFMKKYIKDISFEKSVKDSFGIIAICSPNRTMP